MRNVLPSSKTVKRATWPFVVLALSALALAACGDDDNDNAASSTTTLQIPSNTTTPPTTASGTEKPDGIVVTSSAFANNEAIPLDYSCDGNNTTVPIAWTGVPAGTKSVALEVHDPDAPVKGGFLHWMVFNLPPKDGSVPPLPAGAREGPNGLNQNQWLGPCPPPKSAPHHYQFTVYALDKDVQTRDQLAGATIDKGTLVGTYGR